MTAPKPVPHGTADALARCWHFRQLTDTLPDAHELDPVLAFLVGPVGDRRELVEQLGEDLDHLWSLLTEDYDDDQLDELSDADWERWSFATYQQEADHRHGLTVARLVEEIECAIWVHRVRAAEQTRSGVAA
jgi:hypothetical protein